MTDKKVVSITVKRDAAKRAAPFRNFSMDGVLSIIERLVNVLEGKPKKRWPEAINGILRSYGIDHKEFDEYLVLVHIKE